MPEIPTFRFSRETDIRLDRDGNFWHEGTRVEHPRLQRALASWIDVDPESGRYILKNDVQWCFFQVEDAPFVVRSMAPDGRLTLSDGTEEALDVASVTLDAEGVPYCRVKGGRFPARFGSQAAAALLDRVEEEDGQPVLVLGSLRRRL